MKQKWVPIEGTDGRYEFNPSTVQVRSVGRDVILNERTNHRGIKYYRLWYGGKSHAVTTKSIIEFRTKPNGRTRKCHVCGTEFVPKTTRSKFCSKKCKKRNDHLKYQGWLRARCRRYGVEFESGITLASVVEQFNGICQSCGKKVVIGGKTSELATIDHIKPLCKGGSHTWDNIQLLCLPCNSKKASKYAD